MILRILVIIFTFTFATSTMGADWNEWIPLAPKSLGGLKINKYYHKGNHIDDILKLTVNYGKRQSIQLELTHDPSGDMVMPRFITFDGNPYHIENNPNKKIGKYKFTTYVSNKKGVIDVLLHKNAYLSIVTSRTDQASQLKKLIEELPLDKLAKTVK